MPKKSQIRLERKKRINERIAKLSKWEAYEYLKTHLSYAEDLKAKEKKALSEEIDNFQPILVDIKLLIKHLKKYVPDVLERNKLTAIYHLITKSFFDLEAVIKLSKDGSHFQVFEVSRSANEAVDLVFLFMDDKGEKFIQKWFDGEIISNKISRKLADKLINSGIFGNKEFPVYEMKSDIYDVYSEFTHSGYGAILDLVDPFHKDLDFNRLSGYHFALRYFRDTTVNIGFNILLALKSVFIYLGEDAEIEKIDDLILHFDDLLANNKETKEVLERYAL